MTTLQVNAILVVLILAALAACMCYLLIHFGTNGSIDYAAFMLIGSLLKDIILALIGIGWWFARRAEPPTPGRSE